MKTHIRTPRIVAVIGLVVFAVSFLFLQALLFTARGFLPEVSKDNTVRTFAAYLPRPAGDNDPGLSPRSVDTIRASMEKAIAEQQVHIVDGYAGFSEQTLTRDLNVVTAQLTGVAGNFAAFRQMELLSGAFLVEGDWNRQTIVLDDIMAWQLFGAIDIAGMNLKIQDRLFTVIGVVRLPSSWQDQVSRQDKPQAFVRFDTLLSLDPKASVTAYEVRLPEPVSGMGLSYFRDALAAGGLNPASLVLVDHDSRLSWPAMFAAWTKVGGRSMLGSTVVLPWWENASRAAADLGSVLAALASLGFCLLAGGLYSLCTHAPDERKRSGILLLLASLVGIGLALILVKIHGQLEPAGLPWLIQLLSVLILPQALMLIILLARAIHAFAPTWSSLGHHILNGLNTLKPFIMRLHKRLTAKKETSL